MGRRYLLLFLTPFVILPVACNRSQNDVQQGTIAEAYVGDSGSVGFDLDPVPHSDGSLELKGTYTAQGKTARFTIALAPAKRIEGKDSTDSPMKVGQGKFVGEPGSDASVLLADLKKALEAKTLPTKPKRVSVLPFTFVNIGDNLSQAANGGFNGKPRGHWTAMKIFIGDGEQEGQVFVNYNLATKKGQFSIKDPDYGDLVVAELAKVL
ncbi:MAG TPA: hypothetical protein VK198_04085 [Terriglobales bacterium]|jgi:hypothetical protein|nr:hypothetical protein [Terriglobales bacterium]